MNRKIKTLVFTSICLASITAKAATISIAGIDFDDTAIANQVTTSSGTFYNWDPANDATGISGAQLSLDMTDTSPGSYVYSFDTNAYIDMAFTNTSVYNGAGNDIAMFFVGAGTHTGSLTSNDIVGSMLFSELTYTGYDFNEIWDVNGDNTVNNLDLSPIYVAYFDLDILGINNQTALNNFRLEIGDASAVPSLMVAINTSPGVSAVPLPAPFLLFLSGMSVFGWFVRRK